jgi:hypothetical protein
MNRPTFLTLLTLASACTAPPNPSQEAEIDELMLDITGAVGPQLQSWWDEGIPDESDLYGLTLDYGGSEQVAPADLHRVSLEVLQTVWENDNFKVSSSENGLYDGRYQNGLDWNGSNFDSTQITLTEGVYYTDYYGNPVWNPRGFDSQTLIHEGGHGAQSQYDRTGVHSLEVKNAHKSAISTSEYMAIAIRRHDAPTVLGLPVPSLEEIAENEAEARAAIVDTTSYNSACDELENLTSAEWTVAQCDNGLFPCTYLTSILKDIPTNDGIPFSITEEAAMEGIQKGFCYYVSRRQEELDSYYFDNDSTVDGCRPEVPIECEDYEAPQIPEALQG